MTRGKLVALFVTSTALGMGCFAEREPPAQETTEPDAGQSAPPAPAPPTKDDPDGDRDVGFGIAGELVSAFSPQALEQICVSLAQGRVTAIGGQACAPVQPSEFCHTECDAWAECGTCLMYLGKESESSWLLEARPGPKCTELGGSYKLEARAPACIAGSNATRSGRGALLESFVAAARQSICVTVDQGRQVLAMDEVTCSVATEMHECAPDDCPWVRCGECLLRVDKSDGALVLKARMDAGGCESFAGLYDVDLTEQC